MPHRDALVKGVGLKEALPSAQFVMGHLVRLCFARPYR
ncbi:MAG: hypothetical protein ACI9W2_000843 [Gammaproteobacteria bacterium]|jgi:hypothetical protein